MAKPIKDQKEVFQSYVLTAARYDFSVYEKRILYRIVEIASDELKRSLAGGTIKPAIGYKIEPTLFGKQITMPVKAILANEIDKNYAQAKAAFKSLATKGIEYEDEKVWSFTNIISSPKIDKTGGLVSFSVDKAIWECCWNFAKGYRKLELGTTMKFRSTYTMRFYELLSGQKTPLSFNLEDFRKLFKIENKFKRIDTLEERVIETAKRELDESSPYSFTYERMTQPSRGRTGQKVVGYTFFPRYIQANRDPALYKKELEAKVGNIVGRGLLNPEFERYLMDGVGLTPKGINANKSLFLDAQRKFKDDVFDVVGEIKQRAIRKKKSIGWIINALRGEVYNDE